MTGYVSVTGGGVLSGLGVRGHPEWRFPEGAQSRGQLPGSGGAGRGVESLSGPHAGGSPAGRDGPVWGETRIGSKQRDWWWRQAEVTGNAGTGAVPETGVHTKGTVGTGTEPGLGGLGWWAIRQPAEERGWEGMSTLRWGTARPRWRRSEAGHPRPAGPGTRAEVMCMWLCLPSCVLLLCRVFPAHVRLADAAREPCTHLRRSQRAERSPATWPRHPDQPAVRLSLRPAPAWAGHSRASCRVSLDLSAARVGLGQGSWLAAHGPSVELRVHLCTWGTRGHPGVSLGCRVCLHVSLRVAACSCP